jgi:flagellar biosynthesis GTPase FlhF
LLEKEVGVKFSSYGKVGPQEVTDPRNLGLTMKICRRISTIFFEDDEGELERFLDRVQERINDNAEVTGDKKIQSTNFLMLLLNEFQTSKNSHSMQRSLDVIETPFETQPQQEEDQEKEDEKEDSQSSEHLLEEENYALKSQILNHINENRINQLISFMLKSILSKYKEEMQPQMMTILQAEIKESLFSKISDMLDAIFSDNLDEWLRLLMIEKANQDQLDYFEKIRRVLIKTCKLKNEITLDNIDDIAKMVILVSVILTLYRLLS